MLTSYVQDRVIVADVGVTAVAAVQVVAELAVVVVAEVVPGAVLGSRTWAGKEVGCCPYGEQAGPRSPVFGVTA